jgi:hypothetical protein
MIPSVLNNGIKPIDFSLERSPVRNLRFNFKVSELSKLATGEICEMSPFTIENKVVIKSCFTNPFFIIDKNE